jgi:hypothetical protein
VTKGYSALKFNEELDRSKEGTDLNKISLEMASGRVNVRKIIKFIYISKAVFG